MRPANRRSARFSEAREEGVEPRSPRSERGVLPVRRSRNARAPLSDAREDPALRPPPAEVDAAASREPSRVACYVTPGRSRTMFSEPLANPSTLDRAATGCATRRTLSYVEGLWSPSLRRRPANSQAKANAKAKRFCQADAQRVFLSQAGPRFLLDLLQAGHHPFHCSRTAFRNDEGDPLGRPRSKLLCG